MHFVQVIDPTVKRLAGQPVEKGAVVRLPGSHAKVLAKSRKVALLKDSEAERARAEQAKAAAKKAKK